MQPFDPGPTTHPADLPDQDPRPRIATPAVLRRAEALGFVPGDGNVLLWALAEVERLREATTEPPPLACYTYSDWSADDVDRAEALMLGVSALAAARGLPVDVVWRQLARPLHAALRSAAALDRDGLSPDEVALCERCGRAADDIEAALSR